MSFNFSAQNNIYIVNCYLLIFFSTYDEIASFSFWSVISSLNNFTQKFIYKNAKLLFIKQNTKYAYEKIIL